MKAVIFTGGDIKNYEKVRKYVANADFIICADSGVRHAFKMNIKPDILVGDLDSISYEDRRKVEELGIKIVKFPKEKDYTDTELAICEALKVGASEAVLLGALGGRPDHSLANVFLMVSFKEEGLDLRLADENWEMFVIDKKIKIPGKKGDILSLIPLTPKVQDVKTDGLYYPLNSETLLMGPARGISNVFIENEATVNLKEGLLLAIKITEEKFQDGGK